MESTENERIDDYVRSYIDNAGTISISELQKNVNLRFPSSAEKYFVRRTVEFLVMQKMVDNDSDDEPLFKKSEADMPCKDLDDESLWKGAHKASGTNQPHSMPKEVEDDSDDEPLFKTPKIAMADNDTDDEPLWKETNKNQQLVMQKMVDNDSDDEPLFKKSEADMPCKDLDDESLWKGAHKASGTNQPHSMPKEVEDDSDDEPLFKTPKIAMADNDTDDEPLWKETNKNQQLVMQKRVDNDSDDEPLFKKSEADMPCKDLDDESLWKGAHKASGTNQPSRDKVVDCVMYNQVHQNVGQRLYATSYAKNSNRCQLEKSTECESVAKKSNVKTFKKQRGVKEAIQSKQQEFQSKDEIVIATRPMLLELIFGWVKFTDSSRFVPAFKYPQPSSDGSYRALKILASGYTADYNNPFHLFAESIEEKFKAKSDLAVLKRFNSKFGFSFE